MLKQPLLLLVLVTFCCPLSNAQSPTLKLRILFSTPSAREKLMIGDRLSLRVFKRGEFSAEVQVDEAGNIQLPFIGELKVVNKALADVKREIVQRLLQFETNPQVSLRVTAQNPRASITTMDEGTGRETLFTSDLGGGNLRMTMRAAPARTDVILSLFSRNTFCNDSTACEVKAIVDGETIRLGKAAKFLPTIVTAYNDPTVELRLTLARAVLARIAQGTDVTLVTETVSFRMRDMDVAVLRFLSTYSFQ